MNIFYSQLDSKTHFSFGQYRIHKNILYFTALCITAVLMSESLQAVTVDALRAPVQDLKKEMFGGWMWALKIGACVAGVAFSVFKQSLAPMGIGGGITAAIHFFDKYIGDGSAALI